MVQYSKRWLTTINATAITSLVVCVGPIVRHLERSGEIPPVEFHRRSSGALWRISRVVVAPSGG